jgi:acyl carrier protein
MDGDMPTTLLRHPEIAAIFDEVFQYAGPITAATSPDDVERWDSLQHIALVQMLEATYAIRLSMDEMMEIRSVADIERVLHRHGV